jgi:hypothetical protein
VMRYRIARSMMKSAESHRRSAPSADLHDNDDTAREDDHEWNQRIDASVEDIPNAARALNRRRV